MVKKKPADRHKSKKMVRLTPRTEVLLVALKKVTRRPHTTEVEIAVEKHAKDEGVGLTHKSSN